MGNRTDKVNRVRDAFVDGPPLQLVEQRAVAGDDQLGVTNPGAHLRDGAHENVESLLVDEAANRQDPRGLRGDAVLTGESGAVRGALVGGQRLKTVDVDAVGDPHRDGAGAETTDPPVQIPASKQ